MLKAAGETEEYESQYTVTITIYNSTGKAVDTIRHKIDFRVHNVDGSYKLLEAKGIETDDYKWRRRMLLNLWLPDHRDHV